ncbi:MAG: sulfite exporter TauE/SafE family protein, partial [Ignavibacteria bacterium]|nr:sulfite exporter TauE/SafE family protein [Ignavibacteria bacterium]
MIELLSIVGYLILGIGVGFIAGAFGIGGGVIMVPVFLFLFNLHGFSSELIPKFAIGTSLFASVLAASSGAFTHLKNKNINITIGILVGVFAVLSGFFLSKIAVKLDSRTLKAIFAFVLIIVTIRLLTDNTNSDNDTDNVNRFSFYFAPLLGIVVGSLSAFAGIGGGILAVPVLHYIFKLKFKTSIGTSSLIIIFSTFAATISYILSGLTIEYTYKFTLGYVY